ncbi:MAG: hypothetical protein QXP42_04230 [Candidatus Micrarchaeia archaeon]
MRRFLPFLMFSLFLFGCFEETVVIKSDIKSSYNGGYANQTANATHAPLSNSNDIEANVTTDSKQQNPKVQSSELDEFAKCLTRKGVKMYGADWCHFCQKQKEAFGPSFMFVYYVDCDKNPNDCYEKGVNHYPTWIINDEKKLGYQEIETLSRFSGCTLNGTSFIEKVVEVSSFSIFPSTIFIKKEELVRLRLVGIDGPHNFVLEDFGINETFPQGRGKEIEFFANRSGTFVYYCNLYCTNNSGFLVVLDAG